MISLSQLLASTTPQGRVFRWKALLSGVSNAAVLFHKVMKKIVNLL